MTNVRALKLLLGFSLFLSAGCATDMPEPLKLADELGYEEKISAVYKVDEDWWLQYNDAELNNLIETALANNPDYLLAVLNMSKELYNLNLATSDLFPTVLGTLDASSQRKIYTKDNFASNFSGDLGLNYEVDLYGKVRNEWTAQEMEYRATAMDKEAARLTLVNSVVDLYFNLEYLQNAIEVTKDNIKAYEDIQKIAENKFKSGKTDNVEYLQAKQSLLSERNQLLNLETSFKETLNADSLDLVELAMAVEDEFEIGEVADEEMENIKTVGDLVKFIETRLGNI